MQSWKAEMLYHKKDKTSPECGTCRHALRNPDNHQDKTRLCNVTKRPTHQNYRIKNCWSYAPEGEL